MYKVIITTNDGLNKSITKVVSESQFKRLDAFQNMGGFKRYDLELYSDDEPKQRSEIVEVLYFLSTFVFYSNINSIFNQFKD